jgi:hypothetical protein
MNEKPQASISWQSAIVTITALTLAAGLTFYAIKSTKDIGGTTVTTAGKTIQGIGNTGKVWIEAVAKKVGDFFGKTATIENNSFTLNKEDIVELGVMQRRSACYTKYETTRLGSTATLIVKGVFTIKSGYDLKEGYSVTFDAEKKIINLQLPQPRILSNETYSQEIFFESNGLTKYNRPTELAAAYAENLAQAKREAESSGFLDEAKTRITDRCHDLFPKDTIVKVTFLESKKPTANKE